MEKRREEYVRLMEVFLACHQALDGKKLPPGSGWQTNIQSLALKFFYHLGTLHYLQEGTTLPEMYGVTPHYVDFPAVASVTRSAFETYLTAHYIFFQPDNNTTRVFRNKLWELGGLLDRQKFKATAEEGRFVLAQDKLKIDHLRGEIASHQLYLKLPPEHQKDALKGKWRLKQKWEDLAAKSGSHKAYFIVQYALLSAHAHGSYLSVLQVSQADLATQKELTSLYTGIGLVLMSHFLKNYCALYAEAQKVLDTNIEYNKLVEFNYITAAHMEQFFLEKSQQ